MQISKRLKAVADMVTSGSVLADIGTDHAYIPIELVLRGVIPAAIAVDVNRGPLQKARDHIAQYGLEKKIDTRLSDGLEALKCSEVRSILIAGMGGPLTVRILRDGEEKLACCRELILQPQSDIRAVRVWIEQEGWQIVREEIIFEEGKYYPIMRAVRREEAKGVRGSQQTKKLRNDASGAYDSQEAGSASRRNMSEMELRFGPLLLQKRHPVLRDFLIRERKLNERILDSLKEKTGEATVHRRWEIERELEMIDEAQKIYENGGQYEN